MTLPGRLHVDADDTNGSAVLVQGSGENYRVVELMGRELMATEAGTSLLIR